MASRDEQADILGGPILQRPESGVFAAFSQYHFVFKSVTLFGLGLLLWIAFARGFEHLKKHRELRYRKAMRRKHGIPDSDCRPFAVAYAAAKRAHLEREAQDRKKTTNYVSDHNSPAVDQRTNAQKDVYHLRRRVPETTVQLHDYHPPGKHATVYDNKRPEVHSLDFANRYNPNPHRRMAIPEPVERPPVRRASRKEPDVNVDDNEESRKRSFEDESDVEHEIIKKSRIDGDEPMDGDEQADWYAQYSDRSSRRASKESLDRPPEANHVHMNGQERSKRIDDLRNEDHEHDEAMEGIDEDEVTGLKAVARGKKRDRAEAGSTFGGDDEEDIRSGRAPHHRKRRTILQRRIEIPARGQKRDREVESPESEGEGVGSQASRRRAQRSSKKKKGKRAASDEILVEDPRVSKDPLCGGRRVGDHWEADGVRYKVGDKGERLRHTLVKKARNKYHMPQDSQHPDRSAALEIYVEMWMTDEQYKQAEGRQELAWQEASREPSGSKTPDVLDSPTKNGKNLLWNSVKCSPARRPLRQFISSSASTRINPFDQWQSQPILGRRVASSSTIISPILSGVADSPTRPGFRGFSKWEKQDREAEAMARIRTKIEEQRKAQVPPQKFVEIPTSVTAPGTKLLSVPTITLTPAPSVAEGKSDDSTSQSKSNISTFSFATAPSTRDSIKGTAATASTTTPGFSLSSTSVPTATASAHFPAAPTTTSSTGSLSPFSFVKPPQAPSSTSTGAPSSTMPSIFGKGTGAGTPSSAAPSPSALGATTQPQPPATEGPKPAPFAFAKPDTSSSTSSPAVVATPTTKSQAPIFNATSGSFPSPVAFGSTPAATKAETPVPPAISASATTFESPKPTAPLFSFSGAASSSPTASLPAASAPSVPKFSFGQPSTFAPGSNLAPDTASQPKPTFKFSQTPPGATDGASAVPAADESKKSAMPVSVFGTAAGSNQPAKPSPFGTASAFGSSTLSLPSASATKLFGKPGVVDSDSTPLKPTLASSGATSAGPPASGNAAFFSFGGTNSGSKSTEGSKPTSLFGGPNPVALFGGNSTEGKPTFTSSASADGPKPTSIFSGNTESSKPPSIFGSSAEGSKPTFAFGGSVEMPKPASVFGGAVEGSKSTFTFSGAAENNATSGHATENSKPSNTTDPSKPTPAPGIPTFGSFSSPFTLGKKDDVATNTTTSTSTQTKPAASFAFGTPSGATGSMLGQQSAFAASGDSSQSVFGKPANATPSAFGFAGTGASNSSSTFTFGKPSAQNQKQEQ